MANLKRQAQWAEALRRACSGDQTLVWLHKCALKVGYAPTGGKDPSGIILVPPLALARGFRVTDRTVKTWVREGMPCHQFSEGNKPALFDIFEVIRWREQRSGGGTTEDVDPLLRGGTSPALERYRLAKAKDAERKNKQAENELVELSKITASLAEIGRAFKMRAEAIERTYGKQIGNEIRRMIDETQREWEISGLKKRRK